MMTFLLILAIKAEFILKYLTYITKKEFKL